MSSPAITRTGKLRYDARASDLYATNPAPPVKLLPKKIDFKGNSHTPESNAQMQTRWMFTRSMLSLCADFKDEALNHYFDVFKNKKLKEWADSSPLMDMIAGEIQDCDVLFFVKQNPESKKAGGEFILPDEGALLLQSTADDEVSIGQIVAVGDRTNSGYTARSVVWMLVRGLHS